MSKFIGDIRRNGEPLVNVSASKAGVEVQSDVETTFESTEVLQYVALLRKADYEVARMRAGIIRDVMSDPKMAVTHGVTEEEIMTWRRELAVG